MPAVSDASNPNRYQGRRNSGTVGDRVADGARGVGAVTILGTGPVAAPSPTSHLEDGV
ncbi:hypothetical protein [Micromonospora sp. NPDC001898]|uniref:hypothetical protein n=1 Tax=Micromonospora sp. NPDC001898 TaxID=3364221 RepID=UPI003689BDC6